METLALFDFDKTLVARDSFRILGSAGSNGSLQRLGMLGYAVMAKVGIITNTRYKELVLERVWLSRDSASRSELVGEVDELLRDIVVAPVLAALRTHVERGDGVAVLTASPEFYVSPFVHDISPDIRVRGTVVEEGRDGLKIENLFAEAKAVAVAQLISAAGAPTVHVYTDHENDLAVMKLADAITLVEPSRATIAAVNRAGLEFEVLRA